MFLYVLLFLNSCLSTKSRQINSIKSNGVFAGIFKCSDKKILVYPYSIGVDGFGDRAANLLMIYNLKKQCPQYQIDLYMNKYEQAKKKIDKLLGIDLSQKKEFFIRNVNNRFIENENDYDFKIIKKFTHDYDIGLSFSMIDFYSILGTRLKNFRSIHEGSPDCIEENTPLFLFHELSHNENENFTVNYNDFKKDFGYEPFASLPTLSNAYYYSSKSLLNQEIFTKIKEELKKNFFENKKILYNNEKIIFSYFNGSDIDSSHSNSLLSLLYLFYLSKKINHTEKYYWINNSMFKNKKDIQVFFRKHYSFLKNNFTKKDLDDFNIFLDSIDLTMNSFSLNLVESALLIYLSDVPIGCTGDISLNLALMYSGWEPFYEAMPWKYLKDDLSKTFTSPVIDQKKLMTNFESSEKYNDEFSKKVLEKSFKKNNIGESFKKMEAKDETFVKKIINIIERSPRWVENDPRFR